MEGRRQGCWPPTQRACAEALAAAATFLRRERALERGGGQTRKWRCRYTERSLVAMIRRGEIWVRAPPNQGAEVGKFRPVVVIPGGIRFRRRARTVLCCAPSQPSKAARCRSPAGERARP